MKQILGHFLGFAIFIAGIPALMWWVAGAREGSSPLNRYEKPHWMYSNGVSL